MKVYGIGIDIANINRLKKSIINKKFIDRIFNKNEVIRCNKQVNKVNCYSKRFAAKEAFAKALGTGVSNGINFNEIIVTNEKSGKPFIKLKGKTLQIIKKKLKNKAKISLSLSDEKKYAVAIVTICL